MGKEKKYNKIVSIPSTINLTCKENKVYYIFKILKKETFVSYISKNIKHIKGNIYRVFK